MTVNQWVQFSVTTPLQAAVARVLDRAEGKYEGHPSYYDWLRHTYTRKRAVLCDALRSAGIEPVLPNAGIFVMGDTSKVRASPPRGAAHALTAARSCLCRTSTCATRRRRAPS